MVSKAAWRAELRVLTVSSSYGGFKEDEIEVFTGEHANADGCSI
jgi:hypothetical protein